MPDKEYSVKSLLWTAVVLIAGSAAAVFGGLALDHFLQPGFPHLVRQVLTTPPNSADWPEIQRRLRYSGLLTIYVADPLTALLVGMLVGLLQKRRSAIIAACCMVPNFWLELSSDHIRYWAGSKSGIAIYVFHKALPFIAAILGAVLCRLLIGRRQHSRIP
jgi:hypothetical protein